MKKMISLIFILVFAALPIFAAGDFVSCDKGVYLRGETVVISGEFEAGVFVVSVYNRANINVFYQTITRRELKNGIPLTIPDRFVSGKYTVIISDGSDAVSCEFFLADAAPSGSVLTELSEGELTVTNGTDNRLSARVFFAAYRSGDMVGAAVKSLSVKALESETVAAEFDEKYDTLRAFLWDGEMHPLCPSLTEYSGGISVTKDYENGVFTVRNVSENRLDFKVYKVSEEVSSQAVTLDAGEDAAFPLDGSRVLIWNDKMQPLCLPIYADH